MKKFISLFLQVVGLLTVMSAFLGGVGLCLAGYWIVVEEEPIKSDAIVLLAGGLSRPLCGADLYHKGYATVIYVGKVRPNDQTANLEKIGVCLVRQEELYKEILIKKKVPERAIQIFGNGYISTVEEAESLKKALGGTVAKLLVVTSPYHTRRVKAIFEDVLPNRETRVVADPYDKFARKWWTDRKSAINVILETTKTLFYHLGGAFRSTDTASNQCYQASSP
jgi:uncharacterized SAM-binding protein YcdF (DUF218 family)